MDSRKLITSRPTLNGKWLTRGDSLLSLVAAIIKSQPLESRRPSDIYDNSDMTKAMKNAFSQTVKFLMAEYSLTEAEAWTIITQGVDFGESEVAMQRFPVVLNVCYADETR